MAETQENEWTLQLSRRNELIANNFKPDEDDPFLNDAGLLIKQRLNPFTRGPTRFIFRATYFAQSSKC